MRGLQIGNLIGLGLCSFVFIGLMPHIVVTLGASLQFGIFLSALIYSIGLVVLITIKQSVESEGEDE